MTWERLLAGAGIVCAFAAGGVAASAPADASGSRSGNCTYYATFIGSSSETGTSSTASPKDCGSAQIRVGYTVSGGSTQWTLWKAATGTVYQSGVGYRVFQGDHKVASPAPAYKNVVLHT
jgi:hypothetical protein